MLQREDLEESTYSSADSIAETIKRSTRYGMLNNHRSEVHAIVTQIGEQPMITGVSVYNKMGEIKFSTNQQEIDKKVEVSGPTCSAFHAADGRLANKTIAIESLSRKERTRIFTGANGESGLGVITPIAKQTVFS